MAGNTRVMGRSVGWQTHLCEADKGYKFAKRLPAAALAQEATGCS